MSIFTRAYWKAAAGQMKNIRVLAACALLIALTIAITTLYIPLPNNLHVFFDYSPKALCAMVCGPVAALGVGFVMDILGFLARPMGAFFPGYTVTTMVAMLIYALGFYHQKITLPRVALTKLAVNVICNIGLNSLWNSILMGKAFVVFLTGSATKNLLLWPVEVLVMMLVFRLVIPVMEKYKLIPKQK
ncbi:MAG: folate family ECF transporter S component [Clostridia bacterium]|nr:folate family ECF transporter S component [Clostridia bacterium]